MRIVNQFLKSSSHLKTYYVILEKFSNFGENREKRENTERKQKRESKTEKENIENGRKPGKIKSPEPSLENRVKKTKLGHSRTKRKR